jgi:hypothetical protein
MPDVKPVEHADSDRPRHGCDARNCCECPIQAHGAGNELCAGRA